jgi:GcrA cell cycle regulator
LRFGRSGVLRRADRHLIGGEPTMRDVKFVLWTKERDAQLVKLHEQGFTSAQIAVELGSVTRNAVIGRAHRLKLPKWQSMPKKVPTTKDVKMTPKPLLENHGRYFKVRNAVSPPLPAIDQRSSPTTVTLFGLKSHHCRWPIGESPNSVFCGSTKLDNSSYCQHHYDASRRRPGDSHR